MTIVIDRNAFRQAITSRINECGDGQHLAVVIVKLREIRKLNALRGYDFADGVILAAFDSLKSLVRKSSDTFYLGGSTFGVVVRELKFPHLVEIGVERALSAVRGPLLVDGENIMLHASAGAAVFPQDGLSADPLFICAESALYSDPSTGEPTSRFDSQRIRSDEWQLEKDLRSAVERGQFFLNYQPQISLHDGSTVGFEGLLRWHHPAHGLISPDKFIPLAESSGALEEITEWVLQTALREINQVQGPGEKISISLNISSPTLLDPGFPFLVDSAASLWGSLHEQIVIEITESVLVQNFEESIKLLSALRSKGIRVSIDDFGTGYSSLSYFKRLPADELKIDRSFVRNLVNDKQDRKLVESITGLAHAFNLKVVAEGIEDQATLDTLQELGCDIAQGFFISKPLHAKELSAWSAADRRKETHLTTSQ